MYLFTHATALEPRRLSATKPCSSYVASRGLRARYNSRQSKGRSISALQGAITLMAYVILCVRFASLVPVE